VLVGTAAVFAVGWLIYIFGVYLLGRNVLHLPLSALQTWDFLGLVFSGLANVFLVRERSWFWASRPGRFLLSAAAMDILAVGLMAILGFLLTPIPWSLVVLLLGLTLVYLLLLDVIKVPIMSFALNRHGKSLSVNVN
jgi:H+-transporting ATPase